MVLRNPAVGLVTSTASALDRDPPPQPNPRDRGRLYQAPYEMYTPDQLLIIRAVMAMLAVSGAVIVAIFVMIVRDRKKGASEMNDKPLTLTENQRALVKAGAASLPVDWRERFLSAVSNQLATRDHITDDDIERAVQWALRMGRVH
jgi:hypothetical protein